MSGFDPLHPGSTPGSATSPDEAFTTIVQIFILPIFWHNTTSHGREVLRGLFFMIMKKEYKLFIACIGVALLCSLCLFMGTKIVHYDLDANRLKENELHYWNTKAQLVDEVQSYINQVAPTSDLRAVALVDACEKYNIEVKFALAQGENESHFGTKGLAAKTNSVWNVGAFTDFTYAKIMSTYKYKHPNESIEPYLKLIYNKYMTETAEEGLMRNYVDHNGHRFAADPHYEERLRATYKKIGKCTQIDSLSQQLHYWQVKANR